MVLGLLSALGPAATGQNASARIKSQIDQLRQEVDSKPVCRPEWKEAKPDISESLQRADDDVRAGRLWCYGTVGVVLRSPPSLMRSTESARLW